MKKAKQAVEVRLTAGNDKPRDDRVVEVVDVRGAAVIGGAMPLAGREEGCGTRRLVLVSTRVGRTPYLPVLWDAAAGHILRVVAKERDGWQERKQ